MSIPIDTCLVVKASRCEVAYAELLKRLRYNLQCGHFSHFPCSHQPPCSMTLAEIDSLDARLFVDTEDIRQSKIKHDEG